jgi:pimeloyl-ACP methyl ester carboxylesterase
MPAFPRLRTIALAALAVAATAAWARARERDVAKRHPPVGRFVDIGKGRRLHYVMRGSGPPVVLIHGATAQLQDMTASLLPVLEKRYTVVAFDRPGHGYSDRLPYHAWDVAQARAIHEGVRRLGLERPVIVGHSMGGGIAMAYGMTYPDEVAGVVFISGLAFPDFGINFLPYLPTSLPLVGSLLAYTAYLPFQRWLVDSSLRRFFAPQQVPARLLYAMPIEMLYRPISMKANSEDQVLVVGSMFDLSLHYDSYPLPVAILAGTEDRTTEPAKHAIRLARRLPDSRLHLFEGRGHMLHHFEQQAVAEAVEDVFERAARRQALPRWETRSAYAPSEART